MPILRDGRLRPRRSPLLPLLASILLTTVAGSSPLRAEETPVVPLGSTGTAVLFTVSAGDFGHELWRSDGTSAGTYRLDLFPADSPPLIRGVAAAPEAGLVFLEISSPRRRLWRSDGTLAGTYPLAPLGPRNAVAAWHPGRRRLVFRGPVPGRGVEPWVSDGTVAATGPLADVVEGAGGSAPGPFHVLGRSVYFTATRPRVGRELWRSDGSPEGTFRVSVLPPTGPRLRVQVYGVTGACLVYGRWLNGGVSVGSFCPASGSRVLLPWLPPGQWGESVMQWAEGGRRVLLVVATPETRVQLWSTDGSPSGTRLLMERPGRYQPGFLGGVVPLVDGRTVLGLAAGTGAEPWVTDGTPEGTRPLADLCPGPCAGVGALATASGRILLTAIGTPGGWELWTTDGKPGGTLPVADLGELSATALPRFEGDDGSCFLIAEVDAGPTLWQTDGTPEGTVKLGTFPAVRVLGSLPPVSVLAVTRADGGQAIWRTDGTAAGTVPLVTLGPGD